MNPTSNLSIGSQGKSEALYLLQHRGQDAWYVLSERSCMFLANFPWTLTPTTNPLIWASLIWNTEKWHLYLRRRRKNIPVQREWLSSKGVPGRSTYSGFTGLHGLAGHVAYVGTQTEDRYRSRSSTIPDCRDKRCRSSFPIFINLGRHIANIPELDLCSEGGSFRRHSCCPPVVSK